MGRVGCRRGRPKAAEGSLSYVALVAASTALSATASYAPAECQEDLQYWEFAWSQEKKDFCCRAGAITCDLWDCSALDAYGGSSAWPAEKRDWCCKERSKGCARASTPPPQERFDCQNGAGSSWEVSWTFEQKEWCCMHHQVACDPYDCEYEVTWPPTKKAWCCSEKSVCQRPTQQQVLVAKLDEDSVHSACGPGGCSRTEPAEAHPAATFNCNEGKSQWEAAWSDTKKKVCCQTQRIACDPFDCEPGASNQVAYWPLDKKEWCCQHKKQGCPTTVQTTQTTTTTEYILPSQYGGVGGDDRNCALNLDSAKTAWSPGKKVECCIREGKGCPLAPYLKRDHHEAAEPPAFARKLPDVTQRKKHKKSLTDSFLSIPGFSSIGLSASTGRVAESHSSAFRRRSVFALAALFSVAFLATAVLMVRKVTRRQIEEEDDDEAVEGYQLAVSPKKSRRNSSERMPLRFGL